jgi:4-oxalomesaconate tautomerase
MVNTGEVAVARVATPGGKVSYAGDAEITGVPGTHSAIPLMFENIAGAMCGALLPTGNLSDRIEGIECTLIDNGMPCVIMRAADFGLRGEESRDDLEADAGLKARIEAIRLAAGPLMRLGDVREKSVPKMTMVAPAERGAIATRTFIPHRCHASIGVLGAVSVATACLLPAGPAAELARIPTGAEKTLSIEHPSGEMSVIATMDGDQVKSVAVLRTARKLFDGVVFG